MLLAVLLVHGIVAIDNGLGITPPMGWRSWNCYAGQVNDTLMRKTMDAMVDKSRKVDGTPTSLLEVGYGSCGLDDNWQACGKGVMGSFHDSNGNPLINTKTFPNMKALTAYGHAKGLKVGWYHNNCICSEHQFKTPQDIVKHYHGDVNAIADQEWDGVKLDNCGEFTNLTLWADLLNKTGRPVLIENCHWGGDAPTLTWCPFNFFRSSGDIGATWGSIIRNLQTTRQYQDVNHPIARPGCWAYPDMLEVGRLATYGQNRAHFGGWVIVSAPLILGLDLLKEDRVNSVWDVITNKEVIKVNQQWAGHPGMLVREWDPSPPPNAQYVWAVKCLSSDPTQRSWSYDSNSKQVKAPGGGCLDSKDPTMLVSNPCSGVKTQQWDYEKNLLKASNGLCANVYDYFGPLVQTYSCGVTEPNGVFTFNSNGTLSDKQKVCLAIRKETPAPTQAIQYWAKKQPKGAWGILIINTLAQDSRTPEIDLSLLNVTGTFKLRDLWEHKDMGTVQGKFTTDAIPPTDSRFYLITPQ